MEDGRQVDRRGAALLLAAGLAASALFCAGIRADKERIQTADVSALTEEAEVTAAVEEVTAGEYIRIEGYAYIEGESVHAAAQKVLLRSGEDGEYLEIPTRMQVKEELNRVPEGGKNHEKGGFQAKVRASALALAPSEYEICIAYQNDGHRVLVDTGVRLDGREEGQ